MVAGYTAKQFVELGVKPGELTIVSADSAVPYERPPLSKGFLAGKDTEAGVRINPQEFYREHGIDILLNSEASAVEPQRRIVRLTTGEELAFENLLIATGTQVRTLDVPGARLDGVYYLRTLADSSRIRDAAAGARRAVVVGSGFIGMEVASVLAQKGVETTMVLRDDRIWKNFFSPEMSHSFESYYSVRGVRLIKLASVRELGGNGSLRQVVLTTGETVTCNMLVAGIGVTPATGCLAESGIELAGGVVVNEYLETGVAGVSAAGDVANYLDVLTGKRRRIEHWDNAVSQGQHCARSLTGDRKPFVHVPYFFSDVFDLSYEFWGDPAAAEEIIHRGDLSGNSFSAWWLRRNQVLAAFVMNRPEEEREAAPRWIESKQRISPAALRNASRPIGEAEESVRGGGGV